MIILNVIYFEFSSMLLVALANQCIVIIDFCYKQEVSLFLCVDVLHPIYNYFIINLHKSMGPGQDRTHDPWISNQICYQLQNGAQHGS